MSTRWRFGFSKMGELSDLFPDIPDYCFLGLFGGKDEGIFLRKVLNAVVKHV